MNATCVMVGLLARRDTTRLARPRLVLGLALSCAALLLVFPASGEADEWSITPVQPAAGAVIPATAEGSSSAQTFEFQAPPLAGLVDSMSVIIWGGEPSSSKLVDFFHLFAVSATEYHGEATGTWQWVPGTYHWQASATVMEQGPKYRVFSVDSPSFTFEVIAPKKSTRAPYSKCVELASRAKNLTRRIEKVESASDVAETPLRRKRLERTLRRLRAERSKVNRQASHLCT